MDQNNLKETYASLTMTGSQNRQVLEYVRSQPALKHSMYRKAVPVLTETPVFFIQEKKHIYIMFLGAGSMHELTV